MKTLDELVIDIKEFMENLNQPLLSEIQLEVLLALHLKQTEKYDDVYPEYTFHKKELGKDYIWGKSNDKISVDLVVLKDRKYIPIELKYKTKRQKLNFSLFGSDKNIVLAEHSAKSNSCYDFWKDVKRLEVIKTKFDAVETGIVFFVTTNEKYKNEPERGAQYAPFSIHNNRKVNKEEIELCMSVSSISPNTSKKHLATKISNKYELDWQHLKLKKQELHYLLLTIPEEKS